MLIIFKKIVHIVHSFSVFACSQLFGESDPDQDVSPDTEDPEATGILLSLYGKPNGVSFVSQNLLHSSVDIPTSCQMLCLRGEYVFSLEA